MRHAYRPPIGHCIWSVPYEARHMRPGRRSACQRVSAPRVPVDHGSGCLRAHCGPSPGQQSRRVSPGQVQCGSGHNPWSGNSVIRASIVLAQRALSSHRPTGYHPPGNGSQEPGESESDSLATGLARLHTVSECAGPLWGSGQSTFVNDAREATSAGFTPVTAMNRACSAEDLGAG